MHIPNPSGLAQNSEKRNNKNIKDSKKQIALFYFAFNFLLFFSFDSLNYFLKKFLECVEDL